MEYILAHESQHEAVEPTNKRIDNIISVCVIVLPILFIAFLCWLFS